MVIVKNHSASSAGRRGGSRMERNANDLRCLTLVPYLVNVDKR